MTVSIIGFGHVGRAMSRLFPTARVYDKYQVEHLDRDAVQGADMALVCVPTPQRSDGHADTSIVEGVVGWLKADVICIKSTIPPGTTDRLCEMTGKRIVFSPEYEGETPWSRGQDHWPYLIVGGERDAANVVIDQFAPVLGPDVAYWKTDARTAELTKYLENAWLALQVTFANEFYEIAAAVGADYQQARELWALDPRVSRWHTLVFPNNRGYDGKCLPKDVSAIIEASRAAGYRPKLLQAMRHVNADFRGDE